MEHSVGEHVAHDRLLICVLQFLSHTWWKKKNKGRETLSKFSHLIFLTVRRISGTLGVYFTSEIPSKFPSEFQCLFWSCSHTLSTGCYFEHTQSLLERSIVLCFMIHHVSWCKEIWLDPSWGLKVTWDSFRTVFCTGSWISRHGTTLLGDVYRLWLIQLSCGGKIAIDTVKVIPSAPPGDETFGFNL